MKNIFSPSSPRAISTNILVIAAVFIALTILLTHVFALQTPFIRISLGFLPIAIFAALFGPLKGGLVAAAADIIGCLIFSPSLYFPGFTFSAFISGVIYGLLLHQKPPSTKRILFASITILVLVDISLNTLWLTLLYHKAAQTFLTARLIKNLLMLPFHVFAIYVVSTRLFGQKFINFLKS